ncbi:ribonuclease HIII [Melissococcus plutonius]|uniref:Ribonuclease HIII n=2 Tax=Melissococcus plutonius TaxID=33970 RepID=F3YB57_MELPT|nr:ribonuclease HIII [Melissococcus plutonius]BAL61916.1 ribonuclease HIII [Melissococcus plutonius DAT561]AIM25159.1 ribonuclease HIII [Melissococcus plutonius S1]KMT25415.1 ribonuclease HIII [Melissococcus plutonius]KMT25455.1 ribonuclease HIII [Melissococcus plutonius]KMT26319.1 ribonuclease HIII [Melissococcus plutonius]
MSQVVMKVTKKELTKMQSFYSKKLIDKKVPYTLFIAKYKNVTITAYQSGKVLFQGEDAEKEAAYWKSSTHSDLYQSKDSIKDSLPENLAGLSVLGSDEVGNGSYFGPLTVCAAYVAKDNIKMLKAAGVKDSKNLTDNRIMQLAEMLKEKIPFKLLIVTPEKYNQIQTTYNAVHMKVALHNQAIALLLAKLAPIKPEAILIDQFTSPKNYYNYVQSEQRQVKAPIYFTTKGESYHVSVAAASIISRAAFLAELTKASNTIGFSLPSGAGDQSDQIAAKILKLGGMDLLKNYAKLHFKNTKKAINYLNHSS